MNNFQVSKAPDYGKVDTGSAAQVGRINMAGIGQVAAQQARQGGGGLGAAMLAAGGAALGEGARRGAEANAAEIHLWKQEHEVQLELKKQAAMEAMKEQAAEASSARDQETWEKRADITQEQSLERARVSNDFAVERESAQSGGELPKGMKNRYLLLRDDIRATAEKHGLDPVDFAAVLAQESGFNPSAVGDNGASLGLGQLNTAAGHGKTIMQREGLTKEQLLNASPQQQMDWSAEYLKYQFDRYPGDRNKAIDAYNKGTAGAKGGDPNYVRNVDSHVPRILALEADIGAGGFMAKSEKAGAGEKATDPLQAKLDAAGVKTPAEGTKAPGAQTKEAATADGEESGGLMKKTAKTVLGANKAVVDAIGGGLEKAREMGATVGDLIRGEDPKEPGKLASKVWNEVLKASGTDVTKTMINGKSWTLKDFVEEVLKRNPDAPVAKVVEQAAKNWKTSVDQATGGRF